jgi:hypothetical protein
MSAGGVAWRPHSNPTFAAHDIVELHDSDPAKRGAEDALIHMRSRGLGGPLPPQVEFLYVRGLEHINGATAKAWFPGPAIVLLRAGRSYSETFRTACHELQHIKDRSRALSDAEREARAESVADLAVKETGVRWR